MSQLALLTAGVLLGLGGGLTVGIDMYIISKKGIFRILKIIAIPVIAIGFIILFPTAVTLLFNGLINFLFGLILLIVGFFVAAFFTILPMWLSAKKRIANNPILREVFEIIQKNNVTGIAICHDGIRIFIDCFNIPVPVQTTLKCQSEKEYEEAKRWGPLHYETIIYQCQSLEEYRIKEHKTLTSYQDINILNSHQYIDINFKEKGYTDITGSESFFINAIQSRYKKYRLFYYSRTITYTTPTFSTTSGSSYYTGANGELLGSGSRTTYHGGKQLSFTTDNYKFLIQKEESKKSNAEPVEKLKSW